MSIKISDDNKVKDYKWLKEKVAQKTSFADMAREAGCSVSTVKKQLKLNNLYMTPLYWNREWLAKELKTKTINQICIEQKVDRRPIVKFAEKYGLIPQKEKKEYMDIEWLKNTLNAHSFDFEEIEKATGYKWFTIKYWAKKLGLYIPCEKEELHLGNQDYFHTIDTEQKAYWLGFLMADGGMNKKIQQMKLKVQESDRQHLEKLANSLDYNIDFIITEKVDRKGTEYRYSTLRINSTRMARDLVYHGCGPLKSGRECLPYTIPEDLIRHFIRGFMDGDGTVNPNRRSVSFVSLSFNILMSIKMHFEHEVGIDKIDIYYSPSTSYRKQILRYTVCSYDAEKILDYLYKDATIYLDRKHQNYLNYKCPSFPKGREKKRPNSVES